MGGCGIDQTSFYSLNFSSIHFFFSPNGLEFMRCGWWLTNLCSGKPPTWIEHIVYLSLLVDEFIWWIVWGLVMWNLGRMHKLLEELRTWEIEYYIYKSMCKHYENSGPLSHLKMRFYRSNQHEISQNILLNLWAWVSLN